MQAKQIQRNTIVGSTKHKLVMIELKDIPDDWMGFILDKPAVLFFNENCPYSRKAKMILHGCIDHLLIICIPYIGHPFPLEKLKPISKISSLPQLYAKGIYKGNCEIIENAFVNGGGSLEGIISGNERKPGDCPITIRQLIYNV